MLHRLLQLAGVFLKLGSISFGGPAAHLAIIEDEVVGRRGWLSRQQFLDLVGATHLLPGPNALEIAAHVGFLRAGVLGSLAAGGGFVVPATLLAIACAFGYERYGTLPAVEAPLAGIKAAVLAIILAAVFRLGRPAIKNWVLLLVVVGVATASRFGFDEIAVLLAGSMAGAMLLSLTGGRNRPDGDGKKANSAAAAALVPAATLGGSLGAAAAAGGSSIAVVPLGNLFVFFFKVGLVFFGGGYVLMAYIQGGLVQDYGFSEAQLWDAVAIGSLTPGPMLSMVTFVGYLAGGGVAGALAATAGILVPSFVIVVVSNPLIPRLRQSRWAGRFLDAVVAASLGLIAAVTIDFMGDTLLKHTPQAWTVDGRSLLISVIAAGILLRWKPSAVWLVLGGAAAGWLLF